MQEEPRDKKNREVEYLHRFLELSLRKNYPLSSLIKNDLDKDATVGVFLSYCASPYDPTIKEIETFLSGPGKWLNCSASDFMSLCQRNLAEIKGFNLFGFILEDLIEQRHLREEERLKQKAFDGERRVLARKFICQEDRYFMHEALQLAEEAQKNSEVPIGAVVVLDSKIIGRGFNSTVRMNDPTAHAEILAIREAASKVDNYRLTEASLYVTLEPCPMCAGAILNARIKRVVYGVSADEQNRVCGSKFLLKPKKPTDRPFVTSGVLKEECMDLLKNFFLSKRSESEKEYDIEES